MSGGAEGLFIFSFHLPFQLSHHLFQGSTRLFGYTVYKRILNRYFDAKIGSFMDAKYTMGMKYTMLFQILLFRMNTCLRRNYDYNQFFFSGILVDHYPHGRPCLSLAPVDIETHLPKLVYEKTTVNQVCSLNWPRLSYRDISLCFSGKKRMTLPQIWPDKKVNWFKEQLVATKLCPRFWRSSKGRCPSAAWRQSLDFGSIQSPWRPVLNPQWNLYDVASFWT